MSDYRKEHLRRKSEEATRQREERQQAIARKSRGFSAALLAFVVMAVVALLVVVPMRFSAFADNEVDPVEAYLTENVDENITAAESEIDARATAQNTGLAALIESISEGGVDRLKPTDLVLRGKFLIVDEGMLPEGATIDDVFASNENSASVITQYESPVPLLDPGEESKYFVAMLNNAAFNQYGTAKDVTFARNNDNGEVINDVIYDHGSGIAYVPKSLYADVIAIQAAGDATPAPAAEGTPQQESSVTEATPSEVPAQAEAPAQTEATVQAEATAQTEATAQAEATAQTEATTQAETTAQTEATTQASSEMRPSDGTEAASEKQQADKGQTGQGTVVSAEAASAPVSAGVALAAAGTPSPEQSDGEVVYLDQGEGVQTITTEDESENVEAKTIDLSDIVPVQAQIMVGYNWNFEDAEETVETTTIPVSVKNEMPGVQPNPIAEVTVPSFDTSIPIELVPADQAKSLNATNIYFYVGGSDIPLFLSDKNGYYDNNDGTLVLNFNPMTIASLEIHIAGDDLITQVLDTILQSETAQAFDASGWDAWPSGEFNRLNLDEFGTAVAQRKIFEYRGNMSYITGGMPGSWWSAMHEAARYMYAQPAGAEYESANKLGNIIYGKRGFADLADVNRYSIFSWQTKGLTNQGHYDNHGNNQGTITGTYSFPGDGDGRVTTSLGGMDFSGLKPLPGQSVLMGCGACCHIGLPAGNGKYTNYDGFIRMRPLYVNKNPKGQQPYVIIGFISSLSHGDQAYTGVYKFRVSTTAEFSVKKTSSRADFTNKYPASYAKNCEGAVYGLFKDKAEAQNATAASTPYKRLTIKANGESDVVAVDPGNYYAKELVAPTGYQLDNTVYDVHLDAGKKGVLEAKDTPFVGSVTVHKTDAETGKPIKQGEFTFALCDANKGELGRLTAKGTDSVKWSDLPLGSFFVHEVAASYPYEVNNEYIPVTVAANSTLDASVTVKDPQRRGKVSITKTDASDKNPLQGVTFTLTSKQDVVSLDGTKRHSNGQVITVKKTGDGTYEFDPSSKETALVTNKAGQVSVSKLYLTTGSTTFQFNETATVDGHIINRNPVDVTIAKNESTAEPAAAGELTNKPNAIDIYKTALKDGAPVAGTTIGFWKSSDDVKVTPDASGNPKDAIAIRTPDGSDAYRPAIVRNDTLATVLGSSSATDGSYIMLKGKSADVADKEYSLFNNNAGKEEEKPETKSEGTQAEATSKEVNGSTAPANANNESQAGQPADKEETTESKATTQTVSVVPGIYEITLRSASGTVLDTLPEESSIIGTTVPVELAVENGKLTAKNGDPAGANASVAWDAAQNAWVAKDLAAGSVYRIQIGDQTLKSLKTSETGGVTHYGRYSATDSTWYNAGWTDQAALPKSDANIITKATISNKEYSYGTVTDARGHIHAERIPFGSYVLAEIKPYVDTVYHKAYLADGIAHHFTVKDKEGTISDTDNLDDGYHEGNEAAFTETKKFAFKNDVTKLNISKREVTGGPEIVGALLTLTGDDNTIIDEWTSTEEPHYIEGLQPGVYTLTERMTPNDYDRAESIEFRLFPTGDIQHVEMLDSPISIDAEIDKRQEIAKPLNEQHMENGDGKNNAKVSESKWGDYDYSLDFRSNSNTWTDEFTVEDPLEVVSAGMARLYAIDTPQAWQDFDGKMNVWYRTNLDEGLPADAGIENADDLPLGFSVEIDRGGAQTKMTDDDVKELKDVTVSIAGHKVIAFDPAFADYLVQSYEKDSSVVFSEPVFSGLPDGWTVTVSPKTENNTEETNASIPAPSASDAGQTGTDASKDKDGEGDGKQAPLVPAAMSWVVGNTVTLTKGTGDDAKSYEFNFVGGTKEDTRTPEEKVLAYDARKDGANATLSDGHENPWLADPAVMTKDTDHDGRLIAFDGWHLWEKDLSTMVTNRLDISDLPLGTGEYVTAVRFEYGRVEDGFTTRPDEWDRPLLKDEHDDLDDIPSVADRTFESEDAAAPATVAALEALVDRLTTEASKTAEQDLRARNEEEAAQYEKLLADIEEYNAARGEESKLPEKYIQAKFKPAFEGDDDAATQIGAAREAAKLSVQAAFEASNSAEGRITLRKSLVALRSVISEQVSEETRNAYDAALLAFESTYLVNDPDGYSNAVAALRDAIGKGIDEIAAAGLAGRVHYAPAVLHMYANSKYVPGTELRNSARVDAYRNGGNGDDEERKTKQLEGHDRDEVVQTPKKREIEIGTTLAKQDGAKEIIRNIDNLDPSAQILLIDVVDYKGLTPGKTYVMKGELHLRYGEGGDHMDAGVLATGNHDVAVVGSAVFTPDSADGKVEIPFTFYDRDLTVQGVENTENPENFALVAFEELYIQFAPETISDYTLAEHKDINDEAQTVNVHNVTDLNYDVVSNGFFRPSTPLAQTGDPVVIAAIAVIASGAVIGLIIWRRRRSA